MGLKALALAKLDRNAQALDYIRQQLVDYPLSYTLHYARWAICRDEATAQALISITGRRGTNACELAGWLTSLGQRMLPVACWNCSTAVKRCRCCGALR